MESLNTDVSGNAAVVIVCGETLPHVILGSHQFWAANRLALVRCGEEPVNVLALCEKLCPSLLVAKQAFIEALSDRDIRLITGPGHNAHVLVLLNQDNPEAVARLLQLGCHGVLPPKFTGGLVRRAVLAIFAGELWAPRRVISEMLSNLSKVRATKPENVLTPREESVLELAGRGYKNSEIASSLFISPETVRWHKRRLNRKIAERTHL